MRARTEQAPKRNYMAIVGIIDDGELETDFAAHVDEYLAEYYKVGGKWGQEHGFARARAFPLTTGTTTP